MSLPLFVGSVLVPPDGRDDRVTVLQVFADRAGSTFVRVRYRIQSARRPTDATPGEFQTRFAGWRPAGEAKAWPA